MKVSQPHKRTACLPAVHLTLVNSTHLSQRLNDCLRRAARTQWGRLIAHTGLRNEMACHMELFLLLLPATPNKCDTRRPPDNRGYGHECHAVETDDNRRIVQQESVLKDLAMESSFYSLHDIKKNAFGILGFIGIHMWEKLCKCGWS